MKINTVNVYKNKVSNNYFFSRKSDQKMTAKDRRTWVLNSFTLPMQVIPRKGLESGIISTIGDLRFIHYRRYTEISNPNGKLQVY